MWCTDYRAQCGKKACRLSFARFDTVGSIRRDDRSPCAEWRSAVEEVFEVLNAIGQVYSRRRSGIRSEGSYHEYKRTGIKDSQVACVCLCCKL